MRKIHTYTCDYTHWVCAEMDWLALAHSLLAYRSFGHVFIWVTVTIYTGEEPVASGMLFPIRKRRHMERIGSEHIEENTERKMKIEPNIATFKL